ncbi:MAG: tetratricopeptide repeat protein [Caldilineaceae bacterium]
MYCILESPNTWQARGPQPLTPGGESDPGIHTGGGSYVRGNVSTGGGNFIGRDQHTHYYALKPYKPPLERPPHAEHFTDRKEALAQLVADLQPGCVVTLCGPGGIGKTALAAEAVWQLAPDAALPERFPDGILYHTFYGQPQIDLALEHIARSFGEELHESLQLSAQRALSRRQALLILDGAEEAEDLPSLLAIRNQCGVLITSRSRGDVVAQRQDVDPLPQPDAIALLQSWGGARAEDGEAVGAIATLVGCLPLALRLVGRYLMEHEEDAAEYLAWLETTPLEALDQGERRKQSVPLLIRRSLTQVSEGARQVMAVIGLLAAAPFPREIITVALQVAEREARHTLGELVNMGLLSRPKRDYVVSHALIHTYARERLPAPQAHIQQLAVYYAAFIAEHVNELEQLNLLRPHVMNLMTICVEQERWHKVDKLAWAMEEYLRLQGRWADHLIAQEAGLNAARTMEDRQGEGSWLGNLGLAYAELGQVERAIEYYEQALAISREIGHRQGEGNHLGNLGLAYADLGQVERAIKYYEQALAISREIGHRRGEGIHLGNLGNAYADLGQVECAMENYEHALAISRETGDRQGEGNHLGNLGNAYYALGQVERAIEYYEQALAISREIGHRQGEGSDLGNLGNAYADLGQVERAIEYYEQALAISREIGHRQGEGSWLGNLGLAYRVLGQVERAMENYEQAIQIFDEIKSPNADVVRRWLNDLQEAAP